jgi:hypothetical protein
MPREIHPRRRDRRQNKEDVVVESRLNDADQEYTHDNLLDDGGQSTIDPMGLDLSRISLSFVRRPSEWPIKIGR